MRMALKRLDDVKICAEYAKGYSGLELAKVFNCGITSVYRALNKNNVLLRKASDVSRKYFVNDQFFNSVDNQCKAYTLGFITADGNINRVYSKVLRIGLHKRDKDVLYKIIKCMESNYPVNTSKKQVYVAITSNQLCDDVLSMWKYKGFGRLPFYDINEDLLNHYLRGLVDGDGWISRNKANRYQVGVCGNKKTMTFIKNILFKKFNYKAKILPNKSIYQVAISDNIIIKSFLDWLYQGAFIYLNRKYSKYVDFKNNYKKNSVNKWSENEIQLLKINIHQPICYLMEVLPNRTKSAIVNKLYKLKHQNSK